MNLRQLRYFCEVVEAGHAKAAAQKLFVAPTAISMQVQQLEEDLGGRLFDRATRPMQLTSLGAFVHTKARDLLAAAGRLEREARAMAAGNLGWLSIGFTRSTIFSLVPAAVREMGASFPDVHIELLEILTEDQPAALRSGAIHVGLARVLGEPVREEDLAYTTLFDDPLVAALPAQHPLAAIGSLAASDFDTLNYISYPKDASSQFTQQVLAVLLAAGARPRITQQAKELHTALALVAAGLGTTIVGRSVAANNRADLRFLPIAGVQAASHVFAVRKADAAHPLAQAFLRILQAQAQAQAQTNARAQQEEPAHPSPAWGTGLR